MIMLTVSQFSVSSIVAKAYNRMILNRIKPEVDKHLRINQNGFRVGRTTVGHILALRRLIEGVKANNFPVITFIDFKKAFDTIHRGRMLKILRVYGILNLIVDAIGRMYMNTKSKVIHLMEILKCLKYWLVITRRHPSTIQNGHQNKVF